MPNAPANLVASMKNVGGNVQAANVGANAAAAAVKQAVAAGAPKSIRNRLRNAAASLKSGASKLGQWMKRKFMGRNRTGVNRWTRMGRTIKGSRLGRGLSALSAGLRNRLNKMNTRGVLNRFRSGALQRRRARNPLIERNSVAAAASGITPNSNNAWQFGPALQKKAMFEGNAHSRRNRRTRRSRR